MWRLVMTMFAFLLVFSVTASIALAGMRVNRISFSAIVSLESGAASLAAEDTGQLDGQQPSNAGKEENKGKKKDQGACTAPCTGMHLHADGKLTGIGNTDVTLVVEVTGEPIVVCTYKGYTKDAKHPPKITTSGQQKITKNGNAQINVMTEMPYVNKPASHMGCPSNKWKATIVSIEFTEATVTVFEGEEVRLQESYSMF